MKKVISILWVVSIVFWVGACGNKKELEGTKWVPPDVVTATDGDDAVETKEKIVARPSTSIQVARELAEKLLQLAIENTRDPRTREIFETLQAALRQAKILVPQPGRDLKACQQDSSVLAFVMVRSPNTIHLCARAAEADNKHLAQILIHETSHVAGVHDECDATKIEVATMRLSGEGLAFKNGYMARCGIR